MWVCSQISKIMGKVTQICVRAETGILFCAFCPVGMGGGGKKFRGTWSAKKIQVVDRPEGARPKTGYEYSVLPPLISELAGVVAQDGVAQVHAVEVGVNLGGEDAFVAQHGLHRA